MDFVCDETYYHIGGHLLLLLRSTKFYATNILAAPVSKLEHMELEILVGEIRHLNASIKKLEGILRDQWPKLPGWENLTSIKGIGDTGASDSNQTHHNGLITKRGCKPGRTALMQQCALIAARYSLYLQSCYRLIDATRAKGKAIIALARKSLGIIYNTLKNTGYSKEALSG